MPRNDRKRVRIIRAFLIQIDGLNCCYCNQPLDYDSVTLDHIIPFSKNGPFAPVNLTVACHPCNNLRGNKSFFEFCLNYDFSPSKLIKYKKMHDDAIRINILNIAKEKVLSCKKTAIPHDILLLACKDLNVKYYEFNHHILIHNINLDFNAECEREKIKYWFEILIRKINGEI